MKQFVRQVLRRLGYHVEGIRYTPRQLLEPERLRALHFDDLICRHMFEHGQDCVFVQVGAYDGTSTDPLHKYISTCGWRGVMLEPQPRPASALRELYRSNPNIVVIEAAVDSAPGARPLYTVECDELPKWAGGMASFDREHIAKHDYLIPGIDGMIRELSVPCVSFDQVLDQIPDGRLDLLQIDAEGADAYLLSLFPFDQVRPTIVQWEIKNLTRTQQEATLDRLGAYGYQFARSGGEDMVAVLAPEVPCP